MTFLLLMIKELNRRSVLLRMTNCNSRRKRLRSTLRRESAMMLLRKTRIFNFCSHHQSHQREVPLGRKL